METIRRSTSGKAPLVLIHDGGGTTASYHALESLDHDLYAIENPLLYAGKAWQGGIRAMARAYSALIELELGRTSVLLGGWSFGGLVALEMVEILNDEYEIDVQGVLLLDSVCPSSSWKVPTTLNHHHALSTAYAAPFSSKVLVKNMMKHSALMAEHWHAPQWQSPMSDFGGLGCSCDTSSSLSESMSVSSRRGPLVVLIRCSGRVSQVDRSRECQTLGWEHTRPGLVSYTLHCSANHFSLFNEKYAHETTEKIRDALMLIADHIDDSP